MAICYYDDILFILLQQCQKNKLLLIFIMIYNIWKDSRFREKDKFIRFQINKFESKLIFLFHNNVLNFSV